jgi:hypothetical protein
MNQLIAKPVPQVAKVPTSFMQDQKHSTKSDIFVAIQPAQIATVLRDQGFNLVHLKSGRARTEERADHQTTIARYRSENELTVGGLHMDLVFKVPHLYGSLQAFVGTYRQVCSNGLVVGSKFFEAPRIRHTGDALSQLDSLIPALVAKHDQLVDSIREMQARDVTPNQVAEFVREAAFLRLGLGTNSPLAIQGEIGVSKIKFDDLMRVRRDADKGQDAFSVLNVVQENVMRFGLRYDTQSVDQNGRIQSRHMTARPVTRNRQGETESVRSVDMNASLWDIAAKILMAA